MQSGLDVQRGDDLPTVLRRITETIAWCRPRIDIHRPRECFRSIELAPHSFEDGRKSTVASVAAKRHANLGFPEIRPANGLLGGKLLLYEPDRDLAHGIEEEETRGYVDVNNVPPWETWVAYIFEPEANYLLSWVPRQFISLVSAGINVSPEKAFRWLDTEDLLLTRILHENFTN